MVRSSPTTSASPTPSCSIPTSSPATSSAPTRSRTCSSPRRRTATSRGSRSGSATFSTWLGTTGIWLEDLFVRPEHRRGGFGRALLDAVARPYRRPRRMGRARLEHARARLLPVARCRAAGRVDHVALDAARRRAGVASLRRDAADRAEMLVEEPAFGIELGDRSRQKWSQCSYSRREVARRGRRGSCPSAAGRRARGTPPRSPRTAARTAGSASSCTEIVTVARSVVGREPHVVARDACGTRPATAPPGIARGYIARMLGEALRAALGGHRVFHLVEAVVAHAREHDDASGRCARACGRGADRVARR